jgi:hypothetical protein
MEENCKDAKGVGAEKYFQHRVPKALNMMIRMEMLELKPSGFLLTAIGRRSLLKQRECSGAAEEPKNTELKQQLEAKLKEEGGSLLPGSVAEGFSLVLKEWLGARGPLTVLWKSKDASDVAGFHGACDGHANTLVVVRTKEGNIFGGFAVPAWGSSTGYVKDETKLSFLFVLKDTFGDAPTRFKLSAGKRAVCCDSRKGPTFGWGHDLTLWDGSRSYASPGFSYVDALGRRGSAFSSKGAVVYPGSSGRIFEVDILEVWGAAGPPTPCT